MSSLLIIAAVGALNPQSLQLGRHIASGRFGTAVWAEYDGMPCVAKRASATFASSDKVKLARQRAAEYLDTEAEINLLMRQRAPTHSSRGVHDETLAPYLGSCIKEGCRHLVWRAAGDGTLADYLDGTRRIPELARALGCDEASLPRRVLHDTVSALVHIHACGIAHRDVKPANLLVDADAQRLRLIDFGSSADCAGWTSPEHRGLRPDRIPVSYLFGAYGDLAPDGIYDRKGWYKYDVYSAGLVWLCVAVPELGDAGDLLHGLRAALEDHDHDPDAWRAACADPQADGCTVPAAEGFGRVFGWQASARGVEPAASSIEQAEAPEQAWRLLTQLLHLDPARRPSAAEAMLGSYLNGDCTAGELPMPAPEPWTLEALLDATGAGASRKLVSDECPVPQ